MMLQCERKKGNASIVKRESLLQTTVQSFCPDTTLREIACLNKPLERRAKTF